MPAVDVMAMPASPASLAFRSAQIGDPGAAALAAWPGLSTCQVLSLSHNDIGFSGLAALVQSPHASGLVSLDLSMNFLGDTALARLLESPIAPRLVSLDIANCRMGDHVIRLLAEARLDALRELRADGAMVQQLREALPHVACVC